jgi:hypothetical protein
MQGSVLYQRKRLSINPDDRLCYGHTQLVPARPAERPWPLQVLPPHQLHPTKMRALPCHPPISRLPSCNCLTELRCHPPPFRSFINLHSVMPDWEVIHPLGLGRLQRCIECSWGRDRSSGFSNLSSNPSVPASGLYYRFPRRRGRKQCGWMGLRKAVAGIGKASEGRSTIRSPG